MELAQPPLLDRLFHLRRRYVTKAPRVRGLLQVAPWVDVTLLFVLFLVIHSSFVLQPGIVLDLPRSSASGGARFGALVVTIAGNGLIFYDDERISLDGLASALARDAKKDPENTLIIEADGRVEHRTLVTIYDHAAAAGLKRVLLSTRAGESAGEH